MHLATYQLDLKQPQNTDILHSIVEENQKNNICIYDVCEKLVYSGYRDILWMIFPIYIW